jgi:hypothetical protein
LADFGDDGVAGRYAQHLLALPEMAEWGQGAEEEARESV